MFDTLLLSEYIFEDEYCFGERLSWQHEDIFKYACDLFFFFSFNRCLHASRVLTSPLPE